MARRSWRSIERLAARELGPAWRAYPGHDGELRPLLRARAAVRPAAFGSGRLLVAGLIPNLVPMLAALAFMGWAGITLRIGTAMVLAIALGIAVDDTIHFLVRLREEMARGRRPRAAVHRTLHATGPPMLYTTLALAAGFLSMLSNDLLAIRDMGLVGAVTLAAALVADLVLAPALYLLAAGPIGWRRTARPAPRSRGADRAMAGTLRMEGRQRERLSPAGPRS